MEPSNEETCRIGRSVCVAKSDLTEAVADALAMSRSAAADIVELIFGAMAQGVRRGEKVEIRGFGVFGIRQRGPRMGRNPSNGTEVAVPAKKVAVFKPSKTLLRALNQPEPGSWPVT